MHQIRFWLGLRPRPRWGSLQRSSDPLVGFKGPTSKGRGREEGTEGKGRAGTGGEWRERTGGKGRGERCLPVSPKPVSPVRVRVRVGVSANRVSANRD